MGAGDDVPRAAGGTHQDMPVLRRVGILGRMQCLPTPMRPPQRGPVPAFHESSPFGDRFPWGERRHRLYRGTSCRPSLRCNEDQGARLLQHSRLDAFVAQGVIGRRFTNPAS